MAQESTTKAAAYFEPVLFGLLNRLLDPNKRVQESACTAFIVLAEVASNKLAPYLYTILTHTNQAFALYKRKNRLMLYDAMGTLADAVGSELNQPQFIYLLMPPLITKWNELSDKDTDLFPLLEVKGLLLIDLLLRLKINLMLFYIVSLQYHSSFGTWIYTVCRSCIIKMC